MAFCKALIVGGLACSSMGVARADWYQAETRHFVIIANEKPEQIAARATGLERYDRAMRIFHRLPDDPVAPVNRVTVFVVYSIDSIEALGRQGAAGFYRPVASRPVAFTPARGQEESRVSINRSPKQYQLDPESVLRHEYAHHFMFNSWAAQAAPLWFTEGFAEFHATATTGDDGSITFGQIPLYRAGNFAYSEGCSAAKVLTTADLTKLDPCVISDVYAYGWLTVDHLMFAPGGRAKLGNFLKALNEGQPLAKATDAFGDLRQFGKALNDQLKASKLPAFTVSGANLRIEAPVVRKLTPGEAATIRVRIRSNAGVDEGSAKGVFTQAREAAQPFPDDAGAQLALAEAAFDAKQYDVAEAASRRAIAANPKATKAMLYLGRVKIEQARAAKSTDPATWREARRWFLSANHLDPDDAEPLIDYYTSFVFAGTAPTANAKAGLLRAYEVAPQDNSLFLLIAYAHMRDNEPGPARTALESLAYYPHARATSLAHTLLDMIDKGQIQAAATKLETHIRDPKGAEEKDRKKS